MGMDGANSSSLPFVIFDNNCLKNYVRRDMLLNNNLDPFFSYKEFLQKFINEIFCT